MSSIIYYIFESWWDKNYKSQDKQILCMHVIEDDHFLCGYSR